VLRLSAPLAASRLPCSAQRPDPGARRAEPSSVCCSSAPAVVDIDAADLGNVLACPAYVHEIMDSLFLAEVRSVRPRRRAPGACCSLVRRGAP